MSQPTATEWELGTNPRTGAVVPDGLPITTLGGLDAVCAAAAAAAPWLAARSPQERGALLRACADAMDGVGSEIVRAADEESAMGEQKLRGELTRTTGQLRFMADVVEEGSYLEVMIDHPLGGGDIRRYQRPIGPVAVFAASNFPLAFSVAGGDTAAAFAVGCPVVVKSHPSHPHTSRVVADVLDAALGSMGAPDGVFSIISGMEAGRALVMDPRIRAVAFTGSTPGGIALARLAQGRETPIPVYAEMGSTNPVVITPAAFQSKSEQIIEGFAASFQLGAGQLCTKPGMLFVPNAAVQDVVARVEEVFTPPAPLLSEGIRDAWLMRLRQWSEVTDGAIAEPEPGQGFWVRPQLVATTAREVAASTVLREECFGPAALVVGYESEDDLLPALESVGGSLTGTLWSQGPDSDAWASQVVDVFRRTSGRIVHNGWPTGVAVTWAMHHGGPFPSTTDPTHTSVGAASITRFLAPSCVQNASSGFLEPVLRDDNPWRVPRRVDGHLETSPRSDPHA